jgi:hypothetical protein
MAIGIQLRRTLLLGGENKVNGWIIGTHRNCYRRCAERSRQQTCKNLGRLRERALTEHLGEIDIPRLERFINAINHPPATWKYFAVAVVCASIVEDELAALPASIPPGINLIVLVVPNLKGTYTAVFDAVKTTSVTAA